MTLDYFYGQAGELFSFFRIPKALFQKQRFQDLSTDAKILYGILLDRRDQQLHFRVSKPELERIRNKMESCGILSIGSYLRKMAHCLQLDLPQLRRMAYLLQMCSNNLNQYARAANENGQVHSADLEGLRARLDELISISKQILSQLSNL